VAFVETDHFLRLPRHLNWRELALPATIIVGRVAMEYDREKVEEVVLALLWLTAFDLHDPYCARTWKSHDWDTLDRLHAKGYISDPKSKAKSVVLTEDGMARARELFERHFGVKNGNGAGATHRSRKEDTIA
jgi:hypothetical protein